MAYIEHRETKAGPRWRVAWREDGQRQQQTYATQDAAEKFKARVEAYGNRWPPGEDPRPAAPQQAVTFAEWAETAIRGRSRVTPGTKPTTAATSNATSTPSSGRCHSTVCDTHWEAPAHQTQHDRATPHPSPCECPGVLDKEPRIDDLRHSRASWLIADGVPMPAISRRLGHSSITIDRYGHLDPFLDKLIDAAGDRALAKR